MSWHGERDDAECLVAGVPGVLGVFGIRDELTLIQAQDRDGGDLENDVAGPLGRTASVDDGELCVQGGGVGTVVLSGVVRSRAEHDEAVAGRVVDTGRHRRRRLCRG